MTTTIKTKLASAKSLNFAASLADAAGYDVFQACAREALGQPLFREALNVGADYLSQKDCSKLIDALLDAKSKPVTRGPASHTGHAVPAAEFDAGPPACEHCNDQGFLDDGVLDDKPYACGCAAGSAWHARVSRDRAKAKSLATVTDLTGERFSVSVVDSGCTYEVTSDVGGFCHVKHVDGGPDNRFDAVLGERAVVSRDNIARLVALSALKGGS